MRPIAATLFFLAVLLPLGAVQCRAEPGASTETRSGPVRGVREDGLTVFRGIPYAAPPVGDLRWRPPRREASRDEVRDCAEFGPVCLQPSEFRWGERPAGEQSEDCLTLNVWTPSLDGDAKRPVMVWIHGGGFAIGAGSLRSYDGAAFAKEGVVLVTLNYRLGPFGFFGHPLLSLESEEETSGNYGLLDQIAALEWVKENIGGFGGDPENVTIFGESAGAVSVCCLMVTPLSKGLFHRAIAQSGGVSGIHRKLREATGKTPALEEEGIRIEARLELGGEVEDWLVALRAIPAERILEVANPSPLRGGKGTKPAPVVDGVVLPAPPEELFAAGKQHDVPFMLGSTADDGGVFSSRLPVKSAFGYRLALRTVYGADAPVVLELFPPDDSEPLALTVRRMITVSSFVAPARRLARAMESVDSKAYLYHFTRVCAGARRRGLGATHGLEIPYLFGTAGAGLGFDETDEKLAATMRRHWVAFARTGDPNAEGLHTWPAYETKTDRHLEFGDRVTVGGKLFTLECDLFDRVRPVR